MTVVLGITSGIQARGSREGKGGLRPAASVSFMNKANVFLDQSPP
jgi:hypothetical protein